MQRIIAGIARNRKLKPINSKFKLRPTSDKVREALFNIISGRIQNSKVLDLFAGTGAIGLESLSRGAESCIFIETDLHHFKLLNENIALLDFKNCKSYLKDYAIALKILYGKKKKFDIIFIDPPYFFDLGIKAINKINDYGILEKNGIVIWEHEKKEKSPLKIGDLHLKRQNLYGNIVLSFYEFEEKKE